MPKSRPLNNENKNHLLGHKLRKLRRDKNMTQQIIAEYLGLSRNASYQKYETGVVIPPADKLAKLAELFGVTTDYLLGREAEPVDVKTFQESPTLMLRAMCHSAFAEAIQAAGDDVGKLKDLWDSLLKHK